MLNASTVAPMLDARGLSRSDDSPASVADVTQQE